MPLSRYKRWLVAMTLALVLMGTAIIVLYAQLAEQRANDCAAAREIRLSQTQSQVDAWRDAQRILDPEGNVAAEVEELVQGIERRSTSTPEPSMCRGAMP